MRKLLGASALNATNLAVRFGVGLVTNKLIAVMLGPAGLVVNGQLQSIQAMLAGIAAAPGQSGVVRLTAAEQDNEQVYRAWSAALRLVLVLSACVTVGGILMAPLLASHVLGQANLTVPLMLLFLTLPAVPVSVLFFSCANGRGDIAGMTIAGIVSTIAAGAVMAAGIAWWALPGLLIGIAIGQVIALIVGVWLLSRRSWFAWEYFLQSVDKAITRKVLGLAGMTFVAVICVPLSQLAVRYLMTEMHGWQEAGYWQAVNKLGELYVTVVTSLLGVYYLPRFSAIRDLNELHGELRTFLKLVVPLFILGYGAILLCRELIITLIFSREFLPAATLFPVQMASDIARMFAWLAGYLLMARGSASYFMTTEVIGTSMTVLLSWALMRDFGVAGAQYATFSINLIYAVVLYTHMKQRGQI